MKKDLKFSYIILIFVLVAFGAIIFLWLIPEYQVASFIPSKYYLWKKEYIELINDTRRTWAQILVGIFFLITAYFTWRRVTATEKQVQIAQEGQITERL